MALNFPASPSNGDTYSINGVTYVYDSTKTYWVTQSISGILGNFDLNTLTTSTTDGDGDYFAVVDTSGNQRKLTKANINISGFNNNAGYVTASSDTTFTNKGGNISQWTNDSGYITASSTATLTNKSGNISQWTNDSGYITNANGGNAATLDGIDSTSFLRSDATDTASGALTFNGNIRINSELLDAGGGAGSPGQILSSTGSAVDWIDAPTGGTGGGITTGKAIAMAMVFG
jgi:hypothetical protein